MVFWSSVFSDLSHGLFFQAFQFFFYMTLFVVVETLNFSFCLWWAFEFTAPFRISTPTPLPVLCDKSMSIIILAHALLLVSLLNKLSLIIASCNTPFKVELLSNITKVSQLSSKELITIILATCHLPLDSF